MEETLNIEGLDLFWKNKPELPAANDENKKLEAILKEKKIYIEKLRATLENNINKGKYIRDYVNDLNQNLNYKEQLLKSKQQEIDIEVHVEKVINREYNRLNQEIEVINNEVKTLKERQKSRKAAIDHHVQKRDRLKSSIQWNEEALLQYLERSTQLENDNLALIKYTAEDDSKINELEILIERLSREAYGRKNALDDAHTELVIVQNELDRIQEEFRSEYQERMNLINNWEKVIKQVELRHDEVNRISQEITQFEDAEKKLQRNLREQSHLLTTETHRNDALEVTLRDRDDVATKLRNKMKLVATREEDLKAELATVRNVLNSLLYQKKSNENHLKQLSQQLSNRSEKLRTIHESNRALEDRIQTLQQETFDGERAMKELEKLMESENVRSAQVVSELDRIAKDIRVADQHLNELNTKEKWIANRNKNVQAEIRNLCSKSSALDEVRIKQESDLYEVESNLEKLRGRVKKMAGESNEEERRKVEQERTSLLGTLEEKKKTLQTLTEEVKWMTDRMTVCLRDFETNKKRNSDLAEKIRFTEFYISNSQKSLSCCISRKQELLVQECLEKFQMKKYKKLLNKKNITVAGLKKSQLEFETLMKERTEELKHCNDMLTAEIRAEQEECSTVTKKLAECLDKTQKLQTRYTIVLESMGISEPTGSAEAEILIKAENDKRNLLSERDDVTSTVLNKEEELSAFKNTVWMVRIANEQFRQLIYPAGINVEDSEALSEAESEARALTMELHSKKSDLKALESDLSVKENQLQRDQEYCNELQEVLQDRQAESEALDKEIAELQTKLQRAMRSQSRLNLDAQAQQGIKEDIQVHLLREVRRIVSDLLFRSAEAIPSLVEKIEERYKEADIPLPSRAMCMRATSMSSVRSGGMSGHSSLTSRSGVYSPSVVTLGS